MTQHNFYFCLIGSNGIVYFRLIGSNKIFHLCLIGSNKNFYFRLIERNRLFLFPSNRKQQNFRFVSNETFLAAIAHPPVLPPVRLFPPRDIENLNFDENENCENGGCIDYTRCPITGGFPVFIYDISENIRLNQNLFKNVEQTIEYLTREIEIVRDPAQGKKRKNMTKK